MLFTQRLYIRISRERIVVSTPERWPAFEAPPLVAIDKTQEGASVSAFGVDAQALVHKAQMVVVNPFAHPRTIISDFTVAEALLKHAVGAALPRRWLRPRVDLVLHPLGEFEGGLTQVEYRALQELGAVGGARKTVVHEGRVLTRPELLAFDFAANGASPT